MRINFNRSVRIQTPRISRNVAQGAEITFSSQRDKETTIHVSSPNRDSFHYKSAHVKLTAQRFQDVLAFFASGAANEFLSAQGIDGKSSPAPAVDIPVSIDTRNYLANLSVGGTSWTLKLCLGNETLASKHGVISW